MVGRGALRFALILGACTLAASLHAQDEPQRLVVLVRVEASLPGHWQAQALVAARQAVAANHRYRWLAPPKLSLDESRDAIGCRAWDPRCVAAIGQTLTAHQVLFVEVVRPFQQRPLLTMFSVPTAAPDDTVSHRVELPAADENGRRVLEAYLRAALDGRVPDLLVVDDGSHAPGSIAVAATEPYLRTQVTVDGQLAGEAPLLLPRGLAVGTHSFEFATQGSAPRRLTVPVVAGQPLLLIVDLEALPTAASAPATVIEPAGGRRWVAPLGWAILGVGALALASSGALYALTLATEQRLVAAAAEEQERGRVTSMSQTEYQNAVETADGLYLGALVALTASLVAGTSGALLLFLAPASAAASAE